MIVCSLSTPSTFSFCFFSQYDVLLFTDSASSAVHTLFLLLLWETQSTFQHLDDSHIKLRIELFEVHL